MDTIPTTYKAYTYASRGAAADVLQITEVATPPLSAQAVRIKVHSAALNATDFKYIEIPGVDMWFAASTPTQEQPHRIGFDVAGTVVQVGAGVHPTRLKVSDEVYGITTFEHRGAVAEYVELDMSNVALKPKNLGFNHAAAVPVSALVSYQAMHVYTNVTQGSRVLILGGTTNTGMYALQFAKAVGAYVIVTASTKNEELLKSLGVDEIIDYHTQNWRDVVQAHSIDIAYDCGVEQHAWNEGIQEVLKKETGAFMTIGVPNPGIESKYGAVNHAKLLVYKSHEQLKLVTKLFDEGKLKAFVDSVVPFENMIAGMERVKSHRGLGKVVVQVVSGIY